MHLDPIPQDASSSPHLTRRMLGYGLLLLVSLGAVLAGVLWQDKAVRYRHGQEQVKAITYGAERELRRDLAILEHALAEFARDARYLSRTMPAHAPQLLGERIASMERSNPGLGDLGFSRTLPASPGLGSTGYSPARSAGRMRVGQPRNEAGSGWVLPLALPVDGAMEGEPAWVVATLRVDALDRIAVNLNLGTEGVANIMHRDGRMVVRSRDRAKWVGAPLHETDLFREHLPQRHVAVFDLMASPLDGIRRIVAYRVLPDYPLLVVVGITRASVLQGWGRFALTASILGGLLLALWLALLGVVLRARERQQRLTNSLRRTAEQLTETRRIAVMGDWTWEVDTGRVTWSEEIYRMQGLEPRAGSFHIDNIPQCIHPDDSERRKRDIARLVAGDNAMEIQYRILRADGEVRTIYARGEWIDRTPGQRVLRGIQQDITELAEIRERLRQAQDQYRFLFDHNPLPMWVFDRETLGFLAVNDSMLENYGYSREELLAGAMPDILPPEDAMAMAAAAQLRTCERPQGRIWNHLRKDGSRLRAAIHTRDIDFDGRQARLVLAEDVTEREVTEQRFQLVARATADVIWDWDFGAGTIWRSDTVYPLFGYAPGEIGPSPTAWEELLHPEDCARAAASMQHVIESGASEWEAHYRFRRKDGSYAHVHDRAFVLHDANGRVIRLVGGMLDVSQKVQYESDLRLLRRAMEATDNGIVIADACRPDMPVVYVNAAFEQMTGYAESEILGSNCRMLQGEDRAQPGVIAIRHALLEAREVRTMLRNYRKDGVLFWNEFRLAPVRDEDGALTHYVGVLTDVTERQRAEEQLAFRATHDELTGLPNRRLLLDRLQQAIFNASRYDREVAVVFIDLDDFKLINDSFGHTAGDQALHVVAQRLQGVVRETDTVGRFGGDEFVIVLTEQTDDAGVSRVVRRITEALAVPIEVAGVAHTLTPSIGHCRYPEDGRDAETMLMHADLAMYQAKRQGRNRAVAYRSEFDDTVSQRLQLVAQLREGLERKEFELVFQPLFDRDGRPVALEALVRWRHPVRGLLAPVHFISVCEESGLIVELGRRVLHEAARHYPMLAAAGWGHLRIAVNVSAAQFAHDLFTHVTEVVSEFSLPPGVLELELTESVIMDNPELAIATMQRIAESGVCLSVDDFGTGYSSLAYLKRLPINRLKIDRSFVQDLATDPDDAAICAAIISMAHSLELQTVAEGVETVEQMRWLHARGCDELQGFLLGRPAAFDEVLRSLVAGREPIPA